MLYHSQARGAKKIQRSGFRPGRRYLHLFAALIYWGRHISPFPERLPASYAGGFSYARRVVIGACWFGLPKGWGTLLFSWLRCVLQRVQGVREILRQLVYNLLVKFPVIYSERQALGGHQKQAVNIILPRLPDSLQYGGL